MQYSPSFILIIFLFLFFTVALQMFVGHISVEKLNITIYHLQISENASSFLFYFFFNIKQKFDTLGACMRTVWSAFKLCRYKPVAAADTRNKVMEKAISCKFRSVFSNSVPSPCLSLQSNLSFPLSLHLSILTSQITLCLSHCQPKSLRHDTIGLERTPALTASFKQRYGNSGFSIVMPILSES